MFYLIHLPQMMILPDITISFICFAIPSRILYGPLYKTIQSSQTLGFSHSSQQNFYQVENQRQILFNYVWKILRSKNFILRILVNTGILGTLRLLYFWTGIVNSLSIYQGLHYKNCSQVTFVYIISLMLSCNEVIIDSS